MPNTVHRDTQPEYMSDATYAHYSLVQQAPLYWETRMSVIVKYSMLDKSLHWLNSRGQRGTPKARNDWLHPWKQLVLIRDEELAVEFKLKWS